MESVASHQFKIHNLASKTSDCCIIVCVLNEAGKIEHQLQKMQAHRDKLDVILCDGGSTDGSISPDILKDQVNTLLVKTTEGGGLSAQLQIALHHALEQDYKIILMIDGNNKDGIDAIPDFIAALKNGCDFVQGSRFLPGGAHKNTPKDRYVSIKYIFNPLMNMGSGFQYTDAINGFKGTHASILRDERIQIFRPVFTLYSLQYFLNYRVPKLGFKVKEIPVSRCYPDSEKTPTKINGLKTRFKILWHLSKVVLGRYNPS